MKKLFIKMVDMMGKTGLSIFTIEVCAASIAAYNSVGIIPAAALFVSQWAVVIIAAATWTNKNKGL